MNIYTAGEDNVTKAIIKKIFAVLKPDVTITNEFLERGSQLRNSIDKFVSLSQNSYLVLLTDLDSSDCAPQVVADFLSGVEIPQYFIFNVAVQEAESWLMSDREGFAAYFKVDVDKIPKIKFYRRHEPVIKELEFGYKPSLYMLREIIPSGKSRKIRNQLKLAPNLKKSKEYNSAILPFVNNVWDIENAKSNSTSLERMMRKISSINF